jgi:p21-activated kinase 1
MLHALVYLQGHSIAHCDLRSENLFINGEGVLKVAGFSNAVRVTPLVTDVGAPEVHDSLKFDVWCVGAIVWEMAEAAPPFFDPRAAARLPPVNKLYPAWLQDFVNLCFVPAVIRRSPKELLEVHLPNLFGGNGLILFCSSRHSGSKGRAGGRLSSDLSLAFDLSRPHDLQA